MGCTLKVAMVAESEQKNLWANVQKDFRLDVHTSFKNGGCSTNISNLHVFTCYCTPRSTAEVLCFVFTQNIVKSFKYGLKTCDSL